MHTQQENDLQNITTATTTEELLYLLEYLATKCDCTSRSIVEVHGLSLIHIHSKHECGCNAVCAGLVIYLHNDNKMAYKAFQLVNLYLNKT